MSRNFTPDQTLIDQLILNDTDALEELYRRYWYPLYVYALKKLRSREEAKKVVRDLFIDLWEKRASWPVAFSISRHLYDEVRKSVVRSLNKALAEGENADTIEEQIIPGFRVEALQAAKKPVRNTMTMIMNYN